MWDSSKALYSAWLSLENSTVRAVSPCLRAFMEDFLRPSSVTGPWDFAPLARAESILRCVDIVAPCVPLLEAFETLVPRKRCGVAGLSDLSPCVSATQWFEPHLSGIIGIALWRYV